MALNKLTIEEASKQLVDREISSADLTRACFDRVGEADEKVHSFVTLSEELTENQTKMADAKLNDNMAASPLLGIPASIKDIVVTKNIKTTACSNILKNYIPPYNATIIEKLNTAGMIMLGKTNCDAFAHGSSTENSDFGPTHNPFDLDRVPGGSSGGSAASVAADECIYSIGTDTGGSIRQPAAFCGVVGLKPTYGRVSRYGLISMTSSTDCPGPITKTVKDAAIVLKEIAGYDIKDAAASIKEVPDYPSLLDKDIKGLKVGLPKEYFTKNLNPEIKQTIDEAIKQLKKLGVEFKEVSLPHTKYAVPVYYIITPCEVSANLERFDGIKYGFSAQRKDNSIEAKNLFEVYSKSRGTGFGEEAKRRIMIGTYALSSGFYDAYYIQASKVRTKIKADFDKVFNEVDVLLAPTTPHTAFKIGEKNTNPLDLYLEDIFVTAASLAGLPAMSIPCGIIDGLPVGMQLIGKSFNETVILRVGHNYEQSTNWRERFKTVI